MTDTELKRRKAICEVANVSDIGDLSDGFHTFNGLYYQRMILFAALVHAYKDRAWKSYRHEDGELCFGGGWFIVGIDTPEGSYTYHYENKDFDRFDCVELPCGKHWDGHTEDDVTRLLSLPTISSDEDNVMATEYINRDEALSFPLANGKYDHEHANEHFIYGIETYREWLEQLPVTLSSKAGVVHCHECDLWNRWDSAGHESLGNLTCSCAHWTVEDGAVIRTKPTDFCSYGERMVQDG